ncbi:hypothetical protein [Nocardia pneumoniae]|uniref:hypothetical protein n=1 Tax=Nocardia pneumoniae TaxID=228601 RepID=UPI0002D4CB35|nr:hypothetical protein [Nocardia pneumoniae]
MTSEIRRSCLPARNGLQRQIYFVVVDEDLPLVDRYIEAIRKVITHHTELKG